MLNQASPGIPASTKPRQEPESNSLPHCHTSPSQTAGFLPFSPKTSSTNPFQMFFSIPSPISLSSSFPRCSSSANFNSTPSAPIPSTSVNAAGSTVSGFAATTLISGRASGRSSASGNRVPAGGDALSGSRGTRMYAYRSREGSERSGRMARSIDEAEVGEGFGAEVRKPCIRGMVRGARVGRWRVAVE